MDAHRALDRLAAQRAVAAAARLKVLHAVDAEADVGADARRRRRALAPAQLARAVAVTGT